MRKNQECSLKSSRFVEVTPTAQTQQNTFFMIKVEQSRDPYMLTVEQLSVALRKQYDCHPIPPQPPFLNPKTNDCAVVLGQRLRIFCKTYPAKKTMLLLPFSWKLWPDGNQRSWTTFSLSQLQFNPVSPGCQYSGLNHYIAGLSPMCYY